MEKKYNVKNFRASRVLLLFLLLPFLLYGQDVITSIPTLYSINSVIREIEPGVTLTYDEPPTFTSQKHRFIYNDENGAALVAEIPNDYYVNDMEIDRRVVYDDVAVTDDYVVATIHDYSRNNWLNFTHGYLYYPLPVNADTNIFEPYAIPIAPVMSMIPGYYTDLEDCDYDTSARVLIEHSGKSFFNTVLSSFSTGCGAFSLLSSYQDVGVPIHKGIFRQHTPRPFTEIKGRIDANSGMLYMVEPYFSTRIIRVNLSPNLPIPAGSDVQLVSNSYHWQSLDVAHSTPQQTVVSGAIQDHEKMFWRHDSFLSSVCRTVQDIPLLTVEKKDVPFEIPQYRMVFLLENWETIPRLIFEEPKVIICN